MAGGSVFIKLETPLQYKSRTILVSLTGGKLSQVVTSNEIIGLVEETYHTS